MYSDGNTIQYGDRNKIKRSKAMKVRDLNGSRAFSTL